MSSSHAKLRVGIILTCLLALFVTSSLVSVESSVGQQSQATQLQTLIQVASSAKSYAMTIVGKAAASGLDEATAQTLMVEGNNSLLIAQAELSGGSNLAAGIQDARIAMSDFTNASESASIALQNAGLTSSADLNSAIATVAATNDTVNEVLVVIVKACETSPSNSSYAAQFQQECTSGKASIMNAFSDLKEAAAILATGQQANISMSENLVAQAKNNVSQAIAAISWLSTLSYSARAQAYLNGTFAQMMLTANVILTSQQTLEVRFVAISSSFSTYATLQTNATDNVETAANLAVSEINLVNMGSVSSSVAVEQAILNEADTEMAQFSANLTASLPSSSIAVLLSDITAVESAITTCNKTIAEVQSETTAFQQTTINALPSYLSEFNASATTEETDCRVVLSSYAKLQNDLNPLVSLFPILVQWQSNLNMLDQKLNSDTSNLTSSLQTATSTLFSAVTSTKALANVVQTSAAEIELNATLIGSALSIYSSEGQYLNATTLARLQQSVASLQSTQQMATNFVIESGSLLNQTDIAQFSSEVQTLATNGSSLRSQASSTVMAMVNASTYLSSDIQIRTQALISAKTLAEEALNVFGDLDIAQGASVLAEASAELQLVYTSA